MITNGRATNVSIWFWICVRKWKSSLTGSVRILFVFALPVGIAHAYLDSHSRLVYGLDPETIANCIVIRSRPRPRTFPMDGEVEGLTDPFRNLDV